MDAKAVVEAGGGTGKMREELERTAHAAMIYVGVETLDDFKSRSRVATHCRKTVRYPPGRLFL